MTAIATVKAAVSHITYLLSVGINETVICILVRLNTAVYHILYYFFSLLPLAALLFISNVV